MNNNTNTPNGVSSKYETNPDTGKIECDFTLLIEINSEKENVSGKDGSNTIILKAEIGTIKNDDILEVGAVEIKVEPLTPESKKEIQDKAKKSEASRKTEKKVEAEKTVSGIESR